MEEIGIWEIELEGVDGLGIGSRILTAAETLQSTSYLRRSRQTKRHIPPIYLPIQEFWLCQSIQADVLRLCPFLLLRIGPYPTVSHVSDILLQRDCSLSLQVSLYTAPCSSRANLSPPNTAIARKH